MAVIEKRAENLVATATDLTFMRAALCLAERAKAEGEVPVGAVMVLDDGIIGQGVNRPISARDPTAHAEITALREAARQLGSYRLLNTTLYATLEPCTMCAGALVHARVARLVFGARDPKAGACGSVFNVVGARELNHRVSCTGGVLEEECGALLREFFAARR